MMGQATFKLHAKIHMNGQDTDDDDYDVDQEVDTLNIKETGRWCVKIELEYIHFCAALS